MKKIENKAGITLIALVITVIVILILIGISVGEGKSLIKKAKIESLMTNMITIKANAKIYAEEINAEVWDLKEDDEDVTKTKSYNISNLFSTKYNMEKLENATEIISKVDSSINDSNGCEVFNITKETLTEMGLSNLASASEDGEFVVVYNSADFTKLEIVYPSGIMYDNSVFYTLSNLKNKMEE